MQAASKQFIVGMHLCIYEPNCVKLALMIDIIDANVKDPDHDSRPQGCEKAKMSEPIISQTSLLV